MWPLAAAVIGEKAVDTGLGMYNSNRNIQMQRDTNALNYDMWQKQLEYDKPVNQVQRLKDAGLNPALMYGTGSGANTAPNPQRAEAPKSEFRLNPGSVVAVQQARLLGEQARAAKMENDANDPAKGAPPGSRRTDSAVTRGAREFWNEAKNSGGDFIRGLGEYSKKWKPSKIIFGDWENNKQGLLAGPKPQGYTHPLMRQRRKD